jgi:chromosome segregation ATPase
MSLVQQLKDYEAKIADLIVKLTSSEAAKAALIADHQKALDLLARDRAGDQATYAAAAKELSDKLAEAKHQYEAAVADLASRDKRIEDLTASLKASAETLAAEQAKFATLQAAVKNNTAFADAAAGAGQKPIPDGGEGGRALESDEAFYARYQAEPDPLKRTKMWNEHQKLAGRAQE